MTDRVPFLDLKSPHRELRSGLDVAIARVLDSGHYILGPEVEGFEREFSAWTQSPHCVGLASGLDALALGLRALGVQPGDEVIVPSNTYIATWLAVSQVGAVPVPVEPDGQTHNLDPTAIETAITARTRAVLPVHLYGQPADLAPIVAVARKHGLKVLDDAAQSQGAEVSGRRVGALTDLTAWSFYPGKNLGALGDAGAITTPHAAVAEQVKLLRNYGSRVKYVNEIQGWNSRLDELQAAILRVKLPVLDRWNERRCVIAERYQRQLQGIGLTLPVAPSHLKSVWHLYVVRHPARDRLQAALKEVGIDTLIHYPIPPFLQAAYPTFAGRKDIWPLATRYASEVLSLPMGPHLTDAQQDRVISALCELSPRLN